MTHAQSMILNGTLALVSALAIAACGGTTTAVDRNIGPRVTVATGVYGQTTEYDDVGAQNMPVYKMDLRLVGADGATVKTMTSGDRGFYEVAVDAGAYRICTSFDRCQAITDGSLPRRRPWLPRVEGIQTRGGGLHQHPSAAPR